MIEAAVYKCSRCLKFWNIYRKATVLESLFNKVPGLQGCNIINKRLQHKCFHVNIAKYLEEILQNILKNTAASEDTQNVSF